MHHLAGVSNKSTFVPLLAKPFSRNVILDSLLMDLLGKQLVLGLLALGKRFDAYLHSTPPVCFASRIPQIIIIPDMSFYFDHSMSTLLRRIIYILYLLSSRKSAKIITLSEKSKCDIVKILSIEESKIEIVHLAADETIFRPIDKAIAKKALQEKYGIRGNFVLSVPGSLIHRKNVDLLVRAYSRLPAEIRKAHKLVIVGKKEGSMADRQRYAAFLDMLNELNLAYDVVVTGYIPHEDLSLFYTSSDLFVYPSLYEGFGLPPLEAMACGTPVVVSKTSSLPEVVGSDALLVDPDDERELSVAIARVLTDTNLRARLRKGGLIRASTFSWRESADNVFGIVKAVVNKT
jgi:glycosyltransferase involved in cell wall biosynthesis